MPEPIKFWDVSKRLDWFMMRAVSRKILERPAMLDEIRKVVEKYWGRDPSKGRSLRLWRETLTLSPREFAEIVMADTPRAEEIRESFPPYVALSPEERLAVVSSSRLSVSAP